MNEYLARFREQNPDYKDWSDADLMYGLHAKYYSDMSFDEFRTIVEAGGPINTGTSTQPPFATLPPMVGGALDMLVAFGSGVPMAVNAASRLVGADVFGDTREYMDDLNKRAPEITGQTQAAGVATLGAAGGLAIGGRMAAARAANPYGFRIVQNAPSVVSRGASLAKDVLKSRLTRGIGIGTGASELVRRLVGK